MYGYGAVRLNEKTPGIRVYGFQAIPDDFWHQSLRIVGDFFQALQVKGGQVIDGAEDVFDTNHRLLAEVGELDFEFAGGFALVAVGGGFCIVAHGVAGMVQSLRLIVQPGLHLQLIW